MATSHPPKAPYSLDDTHPSFSSLLQPHKPIGSRPKCDNQGGKSFLRNFQSFQKGSRPRQDVAQNGPFPMVPEASVNSQLTGPKLPKSCSKRLLASRLWPERAHSQLFQKQISIASWKLLILEASGKLLRSLWEASWKLLETSRKLLGILVEASGSRSLASLCEAYRKLLRSLWEAFGKLLEAFGKLLKSL